MTIADRTSGQIAAAPTTALGQLILSLVLNRAQEKHEGTASILVSQPGLERIQNIDTGEPPKVQPAMMEAYPQ